ncbi:MAG: hypothetical protein P8129_19945 [Anaerolineae bacterium]
MIHCFSRHAGRSGWIVVALLLALGLVFTSWGASSGPGWAAAAEEGGTGMTLCPQPGWSPDYRVKEGHVFLHDGLYYYVSTYLGQGSPDDPDYEKQFAYASSPNLCVWTDLGPILPVNARNRPDQWDNWRIWTPSVFQEGGTYYMFYTGVREQTYPPVMSMVQSIMLATSTDPANPSSWLRRGMVFQPSHAGSRWPGCTDWCDCRDPYVFKEGDAYYMYYTAYDEVGGIIGLATATSLYGPWSDLGPIHVVDISMAENATLVEHNDLDYLFFNHSSPPGLGEVYVVGETSRGAWSEPVLFRPGWAHEFFVGYDGQAYVAYLTHYLLEIRRLQWDDSVSPPRPWIEEGQVYTLWLPLARH